MNSFISFIVQWICQIINQIVHPVGPPPPNPSPPPALDAVGKAILAYNQRTVPDGLTVPTKGVIIHAINATQAAAVSAALQAAAKQYNLPVTYVMGCTAIESVFDPECQNGNLGPGESNQGDPSNLGGYDMGVCQFKLKYLVGYAPGVTTVAEAETFAFNPTEAFPYFCSLMQEKIAWAQGVIAKSTSSAPAVQFGAPNGYYLLATGAYNFGETGMQSYYDAGTFPSHCQDVEDLEKYFATALGVPSIFANIPT